VRPEIGYLSLDRFRPFVRQSVRENCDIGLYAWIVDASDNPDHTTDRIGSRRRILNDLHANDVTAPGATRLAARDQYAFSAFAFAQHQIDAALAGKPPDNLRTSSFENLCDAPFPAASAALICMDRHAIAVPERRHLTCR